MDWQKNRVIIGVVVLVVLAGLTVWAFRSQPSDTPEDDGDEAAVELPDIDKAEITSLEVRRPAADDQPAETIRLEKRGEAWWVVEPVEAEADQTVVDTALDKLDELEVDRVAATNAENHARLEVDAEHAVRVIAKGGDETLLDVYLGSFGGGATMVRREGEDVVLAVDGSLKFAFNKPVKDWRNRRVLDVSPTDVTRVAFETTDGTWRFERNAEDEWTGVEGQAEIESFSSAKVQSAVASLARMRAVDFAAPDVTAEQAGLGEGAAIARLTVRQRAEGEDAEEEEEAARDGGAAEEAPAEPVQTEEVVLRVGNESGDGQFYLQREGDDTIFVVSRFLADKIRVNAESFVQSETPEPAEGEGAPPGMPGMPGMPGVPGGPGMPGGAGPGGGQIPPEVMRQIQEQLQKQGAAGGGGHPPH